jgi:hypothetical protein
MGPKHDRSLVELGLLRASLGFQIWLTETYRPKLASLMHLGLLTGSLKSSFPSFEVASFFCVGWIEETIVSESSSVMLLGY